MNNLYSLLFTPTKSWRDRPTIVWFLLSLGLGLIYPIVALLVGLKQPYIIEDDARQHIFWMARFIDPDLFPNDLIANYFQSISPKGYVWVYQCLATLGLDPIFVSKVIPIFLTGLTIFFCFRLCLQITPLPFAGFISATLLNENLWMKDGLSSGTSRAFLVPVFLCFLEMLVRRSPRGIVLSLIALGLFYPPFVLVAVVLLLCQLIDVKNGKIILIKTRQNYQMILLGLGTAFLCLLPIALSKSEFTPIISAEQARQLPEFLAGNRSSFFHDDDPWRFWFNGGGSGIRITSALMPELVYFSLILPLIYYFKKHDDFIQKYSLNIGIISQLIISGFVVFFVAHAFLFKLYLPSRYTQHTLRIALVLAATVTIMILLHHLFIWSTNQSNWLKQRIVPIAIVSFLSIILVLYPFSWEEFPKTSYRVGNYPQLYRFFQEQSKDIMIASLTLEADNLPSFAKRSVFVSPEYSIPYHWGYYKQLRKRILNVITAQYSTSLPQLQEFIQDNQIDFWLLDQDSFTVKYLQGKWLQQYQPNTAIAVQQVQQQAPFIVKVAIDECTVFQEKNLIVLKTDCILNMTPKTNS